MRRAAVKSQAYQLGAFALIAAIATLVAALGFEWIGGYKPCPLCLQQRWAYYLGIPATFVALILLGADRARWALWLFFIVSLIYLANAGLGVYHAGAEWKYWPGPDTCNSAAAISTNAGGLLKQLETTRVVRCDEAPWRFLGLSFAGWNVLVSFLLWITLLQAAFAAAAQKTTKKY
jgi:disulfide bond formation protein DsbB